MARCDVLTVAGTLLLSLTARADNIWSTAMVPADPVPALPAPSEPDVRTPSGLVAIPFIYAPTDPARPLPDPTAELPPEAIRTPPKPFPAPPVGATPAGGALAPAARINTWSGSFDWRDLTDRPGYQALGQVDAAGVWRYDPATIRPIHPPVILAPAPAPAYVPSAVSSGCAGGQCSRPRWSFR